MIICIDGPNGVGKTTLAYKIREKFENIQILDDDLLSKINRRLYLHKRLFLQKEYNLYDNHNKIIILLRWFPSMYIFDYYKNDEQFLIDSQKLIKPDVNVILCSRLSSIKKNLIERTNFKVCLSIEEQILRFEYFARKYEVDTMNFNNAYSYIVDIVKRVLFIS